jgi:hypothetical protein
MLNAPATLYVGSTYDVPPLATHLCGCALACPEEVRDGDKSD